MKKYTINKIDNYKYTLLDEKDNIYEINLELINVNYKLKVNDILYASNFTNHTQYTYGPLNSIYGKDLSPNKEDVLIIDNYKEKIYLQRYYG